MLRLDLTRRVGTTHRRALAFIALSYLASVASIT